MSPLVPLGIALGAIMMGSSRSSSSTTPALPPAGGNGWGGVSSPPSPGGPTVPASTPRPGGAGGGGGGGPPRPARLAPPWPFAGRRTVEALSAYEVGEAPPSRDATIVEWMRRGMLDPIRWIRIPVRNGLEVDVSADLVSIGGVRICCSMRAAQWVADGMGAMLITPGISDAIWRAATLKIPPFILSSQEMYGYDPGGAVRFWLEEQDGIEALLADAKRRRLQEQGMLAVFQGPADLIATCSKDYVLDHRLFLKENRDRCAIYGWHKLSGAPIQSAKTGASFIHELSFFDYSHGVRLVRAEALLDGRPVDLATVYRTRPECVTYLPGYPAPPTRHPGVPPL